MKALMMFFLFGLMLFAMDSHAEKWGLIPSESPPKFLILQEPQVIYSIAKDARKENDIWYDRHRLSCAQIGFINFFSPINIYNRTKPIIAIAEYKRKARRNKLC